MECSIRIGRSFLIFSFIYIVVRNPSCGRNPGALEIDSSPRSTGVHDPRRSDPGCSDAANSKVRRRTGAGANWIVMHANTSR